MTNQGGVLLFMGSLAGSLLLRSAKKLKKGASSSSKKSKDDHDDDMSTSVKPYERHFIFFEAGLGAPKDWAKKLEKGNSALAQLSALLAEAKKDGRISNFMLTAGSGGDNAAVTHADKIPVLVYPEEVIFYVAEDEMPAFSAFIISQGASERKWTEEAMSTLPFERVKAPWKVLIAVCVHKERDALCGRMGPKIIKELQGNLSEDNTVFGVVGTSHIGGHRYAGTLIVYPRGTWMGRIKAGVKGANVNKVMEAAVHDYAQADCRSCPVTAGVDGDLLRGNGHLAW
jgi:hypothetical protein